MEIGHVESLLNQKKYLVFKNNSSSKKIQELKQLLCKASDEIEAHKMAEAFINNHYGQLAKDLRDYPKGSAQYEAAMTELWFVMEDYIYSHLHRTAPSYMNNPSIADDMKSEIKFYVLSKIHEYDGVHALSTFVRMQVDHAKVDFLAKFNGTSTYYSKMNASIKDVISCNPNISILEISEATGYSQAQVKKVLDGATGDLEVVSMTEKVCETTPDIFPTPEEKLVKDEQSAELERALSVLSTLERTVLELIADGKRTKEIAELIPDEIFEYEGIQRSKTSVQAIYKIAQTKIIKSDGRIAAKRSSYVRYHNINFQLRDTETAFDIIFGDDKKISKNA